MEISIVIKNRLGEYKSKSIEIDEDDYSKVVEMSKQFYLSGYEMEMENGFVVIPPDLIRESLLIIEKK
jgi:hypothetical protein